MNRGNLTKNHHFRSLKIRLKIVKCPKLKILNHKKKQMLQLLQKRMKCTEDHTWATNAQTSTHYSDFNLLFYQKTFRKTKLYSQK